jgi:hypothetical protein
MGPTKWVRLTLVAPFLLCGGCCGLFVHPNAGEVRQWAGKELPPGSTKTDVKQDTTDAFRAAWALLAADHIPIQGETDRFRFIG